jgi:hypothetical protein
MKHSTPKAMTSLETGYLAGVFDSEGTIAFKVEKNRYNGLVRLSLRIWHTDEKLIAYLKEHLGGVSYSYRFKSSKPYWKTKLLWVLLSPSQVKSFLEAITPYLIVKRERAEIVLDWLNRRQLSPGHPRKIPQWQLDSIERFNRLNARSRPNGHGLTEQSEAEK